MDSVLAFFSPRKQQPPAPTFPASQTQSPARAIFNKDATPAQSSLGRISSADVNDERDLTLKAPSPAAAKDNSTDDADDANHPDEEKSDDVEMADAEPAPATAATLPLRSPQARRSVRSSEVHLMVNKDAGQAGEDDDEEQFSFKRFIDHRRIGKGNLLEIKVEWDQGPATWEPEENLHRDAPETLFAFWKDQGGRPLHPDDPEMFDIFAIRKHTKNKKRLLVEWLGYDKSEWTWLPREVVEETAKSIVDAYWKSLKKTK